MTIAAIRVPMCRTPGTVAGRGGRTPRDRVSWRRLDRVFRVVLILRGAGDAIRLRGASTLMGVHGVRHGSPTAAGQGGSCCGAGAVADEGGLIVGCGRRAADVDHVEVPLL